MTGAAISQTSRIPDSSVIANKDLRKAAILIEKGKASSAELVLLQQRVNLLEQSNAINDSIISHQVGIISTKDQMISNFKILDDTNQRIISLKDQSITDLHKSLAGQKRRTWIASIAAAASVVLLLVK